MRSVSSSSVVGGTRNESGRVKGKGGEAGDNGGR